MAFSSFSEFLFMSSIDSWRVSRSGYLSFGNRKKSQGTESGEYGRQTINHKSHYFCFVFSQNSVTIKLECEGQVVFLIDRLTLWNEFMLNHTMVIEENDKHHLDFWPTLT